MVTHSLRVLLVSCSLFLLANTFVAVSAKPTVSAAWYASWHANSNPSYPLSKVPWAKYTHLTYAFAETSPDVRHLDLSNPEVLPQFVEQAKKHGVKALISVGGWTGSRFFSTAVGNAANRTIFVKTVVDFAKKYHLDGIDFDWEYPGRQGLGCNTIKAKDTQNFLWFLQELRRDPTAAKLLITAAAATVPFINENGVPSTDVSGFAKVFDWIAIMNYDLWGPWSATVGPNAPLDDACAPAASRVGSATSAVKLWTAAGIPANKLVLGTPAYGHGFRVRKANAFLSGSNTLASYARFDGVDRPIGDAWDGAGGWVDACGVTSAPGGNFNFWGLIANGFLKPDGTPAAGISYHYDACSQTPYVWNPKTEIMVSFDNAQSFAAKGAFIKTKGLRGFATWEAGGDYNDILLNSIRKAGGY